MKPIIKHNADYYLDLIRNNKPFQLSRFGDGEILCMDLAPHPLKQNCDGSRFLPELVKPMRQVFLNNYDYYHCMLDCTFNENGDDFKQFIEDICPDMQFYDGEFWQQLSFEGRITELIEAINPYNPCFIGGAHLMAIKYMKGLTNIRFIETPSKNSFLKFDKIYNEIRNMHLAGCRMFLFSCGYTSKILIDELYTVIGSDCFMLDMGSLFDPYCGKLSRDGMKYHGYSKFQPFTNLKLK